MEDSYFENMKGNINDFSFLISSNVADNEDLFRFQNISNNHKINLSNSENQNYSEQESKISSQTVDEGDISFNYIMRPYFFQQKFQLDLSTGIYLTSDGVIRYFPSIQPVYFGFNQYEKSEVEDYSSSSGLVNINSFTRNVQNLSSYEQALKYLQNFPNCQQQLAQQTLTWFGNIMQGMQKLFSQQETSNSTLAFKDDEFQRFKQICLSFLDQFNKQNSNIMFTYQILRISEKYRDIDISSYGYSKSYLELLGINPELLSQIILRGKQIDLIPQKSDITNACLTSMKELGNNQQFLSCEIVTFDGFPLKILMKRRNYASMLINSQIVGGEHDYYFVITEVDVDLQSLQQLINYRQRLMQNFNLSYEDFIRKELSYLFEDVEYSIHSQLFLEKYYKENVEQLLKKQIQQCTYKLIAN